MVQAAADIRTLRFVSYFLSNEDITALISYRRKQLTRCVTSSKTAACAVEERREKVESSELQTSVNKREEVDGGLELCVRNGVLHDQTAVKKQNACVLYLLCELVSWILLFPIPLSTRLFPLNLPPTSIDPHFMFSILMTRLTCILYLFVFFMMSACL